MARMRMSLTHLARPGIRRRGSGRFPALCAAWLAWTPSILLAQATGTLMQDGHALDASPLVGSGGYNFGGRAAGNYGINSANRYITGNVTGLGQFQGYSPIQDPSLFRAGLGSSGLTIFNRQAVSLGDVLNNRATPGQSYYGREETVVGVGGIQQGLNRPGSSLPLSRFETPTPSVMTNQVENPSMTSSLERWYSQGRALQLPPLEMSTTAARAAAARAEDRRPIEVRAMMSAYSRAADSTLFGSRSFESTETGAAPMSFDPTRLNQNRTAEIDRRRAATGVSSVLTPELEDSSLDTTVTIPTLFSDMSRDLAEREALRTAERRSQQRLMTEGNQDDVEMLRNMMAQARKRIPEKAPSPEESRQGALSDVSRSSEVRRAAADARIATFAAEGTDPFNETMRRGESQLRNSRYYEAAELFQSASVLMPDDPLPHLAWGHALLAAGDYRAASEKIRAGIRRYPRVALLELDLPSLIGGEKICDARAADLRKLLARGDDAELRFLLGYTLYFSHHRPEGLHEIMLAAKAAPQDDVIGNLPRFLMGSGSEE